MALSLNQAKAPAKHQETTLPCRETEIVQCVGMVRKAAQGVPWPLLPRYWRLAWLIGAPVLK